MMRIALFLLTLLGCLAPAAEATPLVFHWEDRFTESEQEKLERWIVEVDAALTKLTGPAPFKKHIHFHRLQDAREPVPWAHTTRGRRQGVHFHVDPAFSLAAFRADWTASHELSHLIIPYLGRRHAWFAEGFASYMQYQVMAAGGMVSAQELDAIYRRRFERAAGGYGFDDLSFVDAATRLHAARQYPTLYWGGAVFFWNTDRALRARDSSLTSTLRRYLQCCRMANDNLDTLVARLDGLSTGSTFADELQKFRVNPGFPQF